PVVTLASAPLLYTEAVVGANATPTPIDAGATVVDTDSGDFNGGYLTIDYTNPNNSNATDQLLVNNQGTGNLQISTSGTTVGSTGGRSIRATEELEGTAAHDARALHLQNASRTPVGRSPPAVLAPSATVVDPDSHDYNTGTLTVYFASGATANDALAIQDQG